MPPILAVVLASVFAAAQLQRAEDAVLVLNLRAAGVSADDASILSAQLAEAVSQQIAGRVITAGEIDALVALQKDRAVMSCADEACIAEMSKMANAARVISGTVGQVGEGIVVSLTMVDARRAVPLGSSSRTLKTTSDALAAIPTMVLELLGSGAAAAGPKYQLPGGRDVSFAVVDLKASGLAEDIAKNLTHVLAAELKKVDGTRVVGRDDIAAMLELQAQKIRVGCDDVACLAEIGGALGVEKLVVGHAGKLGEAYVISLRLIDVRSSSADARVSESFQGVQEQLLPAVRRAGRALLGVTSNEPGTLALSSSEAAMDVLVDEQSVGATPLPPIAALTPGKHVVLLRKEGFADWRSDVYIDPGTATPVWVSAIALPPPFYKTWWFWTGVAVVAAGSATAIIYATRPTADPQTGLGQVSVAVP